MRIDRCVLQRSDVGADRHDLDLTHLVGARVARRINLVKPRGRRLAAGLAQPGFGKPGIEYDALARHGRKAFTGRTGQYVAHSLLLGRSILPRRSGYNLISTRRSAGSLKPSDDRGNGATAGLTTIACADTPWRTSSAFTGATFSGRPTSVTRETPASATLRTAEAAVGDRWPPLSANTTTLR